MLFLFHLLSGEYYPLFWGSIQVPLQAANSSLSFEHIRDLASRRGSSDFGASAPVKKFERVPYLVRLTDAKTGTSFPTSRISPSYDIDHFQTQSQCPFAAFRMGKDFDRQSSHAFN